METAVIIYASACTAWATYRMLRRIIKTSWAIHKHDGVAYCSKCNRAYDD
jgi:hypothetical protein